MAHYPGYTVLRTEDCPEQHGTLTLLTHDVSGAAVLLVENEDVNKAFGIGFGKTQEPFRHRLAAGVRTGHMRPLMM